MDRAVDPLTTVGLATHALTCAVVNSKAGLGAHWAKAAPRAAIARWGRASLATDVGPRNNSLVERNRGSNPCPLAAVVASVLALRHDLRNGSTSISGGPPSVAMPSTNVRTSHSGRGRFGRIHELLRQLRASNTANAAFADDMEREVEALSSRRAFGLNFERHTPEEVENLAARCAQAIRCTSCRPAAHCRRLPTRGCGA